MYLLRYLCWRVELHHQLCLLLTGMVQLPSRNPCCRFLLPLHHDHMATRWIYFWWAFCFFLLVQWMEPTQYRNMIALSSAQEATQFYRFQSRSWSTSFIVISETHRMWNPNLHITGPRICSSRSLLCISVVCSTNMNQSHDQHFFPFIMLTWARTSFFRGTKMNLSSTRSSALFRTDDKHLTSLLSRTQKCHTIWPFFSRTV